MKPGDIVWTEAYGHIGKWIVLRKDDHGFFRLYHIQEEGRLIDRDEFFNTKEDDVFATEAEAIQEAIKWAKEDFENRLHDHAAFIEKMAKKLAKTEDKDVKTKAT